MRPFDMLMLTKYGYITEFDIRMHDIDCRAVSHHIERFSNPRIKKVYYVFPKKLKIKNIIHHIPEKAGILHVTKNEVLIYREAQNNPKARKVTAYEKRRMTESGARSIWTMKKRIRELTNKIKKMEKK